MNLFFDCLPPEVTPILSINCMGMFYALRNFFAILMWHLSSTSLVTVSITLDLFLKAHGTYQSKAGSLKMSIVLVWSTTSTRLDPFKCWRWIYENDLSFYSICNFYLREVFLNLLWPLEVKKYLSIMYVVVSSFFQSILHQHKREKFWIYSSQNDINYYIRCFLLNLSIR